MFVPQSIDAATWISSLLGLIYFTSWSLSFYPQILHNIRRHSVSGATIAYPLLNALGFAAYTIYTACLLFSPVIRAQYAARHPASTVPSVSGWDLAFAAHGFCMVVVILTQYWGRKAIWGWEGRWRAEDGDGADEGVAERLEEEDRRATEVDVWVWVTFWVGVVGLLAVIGTVLIRGRGGGREASGWAYIDIVYAMSNVKLYVTITKYIPQVIYNARIRSTSGWSIAQVQMDFIGGVASIAQLFVDAYRLSETGTSERSGWKDGVVGNIAKFWLGNVSIGFDIIFMVQHYCLYSSSAAKRLGSEEPDDTTEDANWDHSSERQPLLGTRRERSRGMPYE